MRTSDVRAFSFVELLICLALVGVLAAIAMPNFREAQVSSSVALAKADLQTLKQGLEAYKLDLGRYPWSNADRSALAFGSYTGAGMKPTLERLTTPVAYISGAPFYDPFSPDRIYRGPDLEELFTVENTPDSRYFSQYFYMARNLKDESVWDQTSPQDVDPYWYMLESSGPDKHHHWVWQVLNTMTSDTLETRGFLGKTLYDPTNGSVSRGSIWVVGGEPQGNGVSMAHMINAANAAGVDEWRVFE